MENIFIQKIFALTEEILRGDFQFETMNEVLQGHLARAQKTQMVRYESEVLNTLGLLHGAVGNGELEMQYFLQGLEKSQQSEDIDLKIKFLSNLAETYMLRWELDTAIQYIDRGIEIGQQGKPNQIGMIYLHANKITHGVLVGDFARSKTVLEDAWHIAENPDLLNYSRYEYFQVIFQLRHLNALVELAAGQCKAALDNLEQAIQLAGESKNSAFHISTHLARLYYALLCEQDEASAHEWEQKAAQTAGGQLPYGSILEIALFMLHNQQPERARRYAQQVLEQAASDKQIPAGAIGQAQRIMETVS